MSLGFNANRKRQTTNLPGSIGAATIYVRRPPPRPLLRPREITKTLASAARDAPRDLAPASREVAVSREVAASREVGTSAPVPQEDEDHSSHWVYATAVKDVMDVEDETRVVCAAGKRALLVYPMTTDPDTGRVRMRCKAVHPVTGQLSYATVLVYDPDTEERPLVDFALC